jgi:hypothetical protein
MANYEDYLQRRDGVGEQLNSELDIAQTNTANRQQPDFQMPDKFANKSPEEIAQSYAALEQLNSRQAQDLGQMRRTVDQLVDLESQRHEQAAPAPEPVTVDDLWEQPQEAIARAVNPQISGMQHELQALRQEMAEGRLDKKYEGWKQDVATPEFQTWVSEKPYRQRLVTAAQQNDPDAADELLDMYKDSTSQAQTNVENQRQADLSNASLERPGAPSAHSSGGDIFSRNDILERKIAAKQGDNVQDRWLKANAEQIRLAYAEGRVRD